MKSYLTFFFLLSSFIVQAQNWGTNTISQFTNEANDVELNNNQEAYIAGYITGETAFNSSNVVPSAAGNGDIYIAKYANSGSLLWKKTFGGNYSDRAVDLAVGPDQNIVVTGQFFGSVTFGTTTLTSVSNSKDIFVVKLDPQGDVLWARSEGGNMAENAYGITIDHQNNVILTGQFQGTANIAGNSYTSEIDPETSLFSYDLFISKYSSTGTPTWTKTGSAHYEDRGLAVAVDDQNNIFFTGQFSDTLIFSGNSYNNIGYNTGFLCKLNPNGNVQFFNLLKAGMVLPYDLELNSDNEVVVTGDFLGNMNYYDASGPHGIQNPFDKQLFVLKTGNNGSYNWNYTLGSNNELSARSVSMDPHKDIFVTGYFKCDLSQAQDTATGYFNSVGFKDAYLLKLDNDGNNLYLKHFGGKMDDEGLGIAIQQNDQPYLCGSYTKDLWFPYNSQQTSYNYTAFGLQNSIQPHLAGDSTRNSFLINHLNTYTEPLNYFYNLSPDSLVGYIVGTIPEVDTLNFCMTGMIEYNPMTGVYFGPDYHFQWNNEPATTMSGIGVYETGDNWVRVTRDDECSTDIDSIHVIVHQQPYLPHLSDNLGINNFNSGANYQSFGFCDTGSVTVWFTNPDPTATLSLSFNGSPLTGLGPHVLNEEGIFSVHAANGYCDTISHFEIVFQHEEIYDTIQPDIVMLTNCPTGDSVQICEGEAVQFHAIDLFLNPNANFNPVINQYPIGVDWSINGQSTGYQNQYEMNFTPATSGWYSIGIAILLGYDNLCGIDTTHYYYEESFYIEILPVPNWSLNVSGNNLLCPEGTVTLTVDNPHPDFVWSGPGIIDYPTFNSITINTEGFYSYSGTITDPITGCTADVGDGLLVLPKTAPAVTSLPSDGIVCPYDSILLSIPSVYVDYNWVGPFSENLSNTNQLYADELGFYYCHVTDIEGCVLTTPPFELREYATPGIMIYPDPYLCEGESVTISVNYTGAPNFQWININSTQDEITVSQAGIYAVQITQCGFTLIDSVEIFDGTFDVTISTQDSVLCFNEETPLIGSILGSSYEWNNGQITGSSYLVNEPGTYSATVTNEYGCTAQTNSITITTIPESVLPSVVDSITICSGADVTLSDSAAFELNWYSSVDTTFILTSNEFILTGLTQDTSFIVAYQSNTCPLAYGTVSVLLLDTLGNYEITGDSLLCQHEDGLFSINTTMEEITWYANQQAIGSANPILIPFTTLEADPVITVQISNECYTTGVSDSVIILPQTHISLVNDSITLCYYDTELAELVNSDLDSVVWNSNIGTVYDHVLILTGNNTYGAVSVYAFDNNGCQTDTASLTVITPDFNSTITVDFNSFCLGDSGTISVQTNADSLIWTTPFGTVDTTALSFSIDSYHSGMYYLEQWDNLGCHYTDSVYVPLYQFPELSILPDSIFCLNDVFTFYFPNDTNTYSWLTYGNSSDIPILFDQELILNVTSPHGCMTSDTLVVHTVNCADELPNFITANGDGINDIFFIDDASAQIDNELVLMNRYGNTVFETDYYQNNFDGGNLTEGVYFYIYYPDGKKSAANYRQGFLEILRD